MKSWLLRLLLLAAILALTGLAIFSVLFGMKPQEATYAEEVQHLQVLDTLLNEAVLRSRSGLLLSYDPLVFAVRESARIHQGLLRVPSFVGESEKRELVKRVEESFIIARDKAALVEEFKTENSVLRTSLHYFPILMSRFLDDKTAPAPPELGAEVQALGSAVMLFEATGDSEARRRVEVTSEKLAAAVLNPSLERARADIDLSIRHASILLERKPTVDGLVRRILSAPTAQHARGIEQLFGALKARALGQAELRRQWLLGLLLGAIILGLVEVILSMRRAASAREALTIELKQAHARLEEEHERERQTSAARSRFLAMTSHEIRTPLTAITSSAELLESFGQKWDVERRLDHVRRIREASLSMERMLEDVLIIGRADAGGLSSAPAPILLGAFCRQLVEALEQRTQKTHPIQFSFQGDESVSLDERLLQHVLGNLLSNAIKYSSAGSTVSFSVHAQAEHCEFVVADQGLGIPGEHLPNLYVSYSRAKNAEHLPGTGLGLAVVKRAVDAQGGSITLSSEVGKGTTFVVRIPRRHEDRRSTSSL
jgi:signal transduction histidine kinase